ncbi:MAG: methylmalonyl-CoA carboxyltransferase [Dehalococcoidia bacterium]|nr:methylmalonyl-CoA carboxyltransferase [Dehalococcoidia bacterium]
MSLRDRLDDLQRRKDQAALGGGARRIEAQHQRGKLTARERLQLLADPGTFEEFDALVVHRSTDFGVDQQRFPGDSVVTGYARIEGRPVCVFSQDFTVIGGSVSEVAAEKICKIMDLALKAGVPIIGINDGGGARIQEGVASLKGYGEIFRRNVRASGVIPQISVILGPAAGGAVYSPSITDFVFMVQDHSFMFITGPDVVKAVTMEEVTDEDLGGASIHATRSGVAHFSIDTEEACLAEVRRLVAFLPPNNLEDAPIVEMGDDPRRRDEDMLTILPEVDSHPYDVREVIYRVIDSADFLEVHADYAQNIVAGLARLAGRTVGIVANQPLYLAGTLDIAASTKAARFVRFCDCFNIPIVTFVDVTGYLPGTAQEWGGIISHGAKLVYAYAEATVPKVTCILRKAYGGAYIAMGSKHLGGDVNLSWPSGSIAVTGPDAAVNIVFRSQLEKAPESRQQLMNDYQERFANPYVTAGRGYIDDVIDPRDTRWKLIRSLEMLQNKGEHAPQKKHGNIPL